MLENLFDLTKQTGSDFMNSDNGLDNKHSDESMKLASSTITDVLKQQVSNGNGQDVMNLLSGNSSMHGNNVVQTIVQTFAGNLMQKFGIGNTQALGIANQLIPLVMNSFINKTNDPNDSSFDLQSIAGTLLSGNNGGMNVSSLMNLLGGNNNNNNNNNSGGGDLLNNLSKLF